MDEVQMKPYQKKAGQNMKTNSSRSTLVGLAMVAAVVLTGLCITSEAKGAKPPPPPPLPVDTGYVYYLRSIYLNGQYSPAALWSMQPDGAAKQQVMPDLFVYAGNRQPWEPSRLRHNGARWFLGLEQTGGSDPDGFPHFELFAVSESGLKVQLTDDLTLQAWTGGITPQAAVPRWTVRAGVVDGRISFLGRRWVESGGQPVATDVGVYVLDFDPDLLGVLNVQGQPVLPPLTPSLWVRIHKVDPCTIDPASGRCGAWAPVGGMDWSPNGRYFVLADDVYPKLFVVDTAAQTDLDVDDPQTPFIANDLSFGPRWSPDGTEIAYQSGAWSTARINAVKPDGTGKRTILSLSSKGTQNFDHFFWSPHGSHVVFGIAEQVRATFGHAIERVARDGSGRTVLSPKGLDDLRPVGWLE